LLPQHDHVPIQQFLTLSSACFLISINAIFSANTPAGLEESISIFGSIEDWLAMGRVDAFAHRVQGDSYSPADIVGISSHFRRLEYGNSGCDSDRYGDYST
jgi:hypothetical protein